MISKHEGIYLDEVTERDSDDYDPYNYIEDGETTPRLLYENNMDDFDWEEDC